MLIKTKIKGPSILTENAVDQIQSGLINILIEEPGFRHEIRFTDNCIFANDYYLLLNLAKQYPSLQEILDKLPHEESVIIDTDQLITFDSYDIRTKSSSDLRFKGSQFIIREHEIIVYDFFIGEYSVKGHCGIGTPLFLEMLRIAKANNPKLTHVILEDVISQAVVFWEKIGFEIPIDSYGRQSRSVALISDIFKLHNL